ncbi:hypothetical protein [Rhodopirellula sp. SWK7]|uniref:hypothetical protein n=1 Tax=Rhodopirellula sp. SWK7 TaxID=595460 RepID=UPI0002BE04CD|nr:hypothetical protein [Rhodopirellula sp. SWK7]EMI46689.1 hypothetical protein RRSWK_00821 [Rhodopirellula sp. SWK7]
MNSSESFDSNTPADSRDVDHEDADDAMLDVLLSEVVGGQSPPDQSRIIIQRLDDTLVRSGSANPSGTQKTLRPKKTSTSTWPVVVAAVAIVVLAIGTAVGIRFRNGINVAQKPTLPVPGEKSVATASIPDSAPGNSPSDAPEQSPKSDTPSGNLPSRSIELADSSSDSNSFNTESIGLFERAQKNQGEQTDSPPPTPREMTLVSNVMSDRLERYWDRVGVQPTGVMPADAVSERLQTRFGIRVPRQAIGNSERMLAALSQSHNIDALSVRVLSAIASRPPESMTSPSDQLMATQVNETLRSGSGFDQLCASWFTKRDPSARRQPRGGGKPIGPQTNGNDQRAPTASFNELLRPLDEHETLVTTAAVTLNADVRCQRCHDLPQSGGSESRTLGQHDYWQLAATIAPWIPIRPNAPAGRFYDMPDGRQRLAQVDPDADWPDQLLGSRSLAEGLVGAMWKMVHGRPLASSPYDLSGSAADSDLQRIRDELADDLLASDFNLLRTIALMMSDSIVARSTPPAMTPAGVLTASDADWTGAVAAVESFAASPPALMPTSLSHRMRLVQQSSLPQISGGGSGGSVLAQPLGIEDSESVNGGNDRRRGTNDPDRSQPNKGEPAKPSQAVLAGLPMRPTVVMPAWIGELPDFESRLQHISYLAGLGNTPEAATKLAAQMQDARVEEALILQRIWWIIRPQG